MILLLCSIVHPILISRPLGFQQYVLPNSISLIPNYIMGFGGSPISGATTNLCLVPSYILIVGRYFVAPFIRLIPFGAPLYLFVVNLSLQVISFDFEVAIFGFWVTFYLGFYLAKLGNIYIYYSGLIEVKRLCQLSYT